MNTDSSLGTETCPHLLLVLTLVHLPDPVSRLKEWHRGRCPRWRGIFRRVPSLCVVPVSLYRQDMSRGLPGTASILPGTALLMQLIPKSGFSLWYLSIPLDMRRSVLACKVQGWVPLSQLPRPEGVATALSSIRPCQFESCNKQPRIVKSSQDSSRSKLSGHKPYV